ncbi:testin [Brachyhypopomus gauderio]|uniref:testin n=1 Tax=Brachyhypopomus gauderio TaxID=698409 RepID=UPI0040424714
MEIEKEVKKMTLGHEVGAGAACLKCKDKCEGFALHFWRKICRNCKCGVEDHDVQLQSEENQKVGRLFEDTKYTGLIAKLKRDGVPTYPGHQVTISIATPAIGTALSVPAAATAAVLMPDIATSPGAPSGPAHGAAPSGPAHGAAPSGPAHGAAPSGPAHGAAPSGPAHGAAPSGPAHGAAPCGPAHGAAPCGPAHGAAPCGHAHGAAPCGHAHGAAPCGHAHGAAPCGHAHGAAPCGHAHGAAPCGHAHGAAPCGHTHGTPSGPAQGAPCGHAHGASFVPAPGAPSIHTPVATAPFTPAAMPARKDVVKAITYDWAPPGVDQSLALRYMELLPPERRPVAGTQGADYRKKQMAKQLPEHDQDPARCHELSPAEVKQMQQYVRKYKDEALGIGDLTLPEEMAAAAGPAGAKGLQSPAAGAQPGAGDQGSAVAAVGRAGMPGAPGAGSSGPAGSYTCHHCQQDMRHGEPAVYAERAGYDRLWHPACFVCCTCEELLVDMIYFWKKGRLFCGRHYGDSEKPRCGGCDELIFSNEYTQAEGQNWHLKHFCCFDCDCVLAGETYVMEKDKPICKPCYMKNHAVHCTACQGPIEPEAQRVSYGEHHWHAEAGCFRCSGCSKCLTGQRFMALQDKLLCSVECKKKVMAS